MPEDINTYDALPYDSNPLYPTHPGCIATTARLLGLRTPPIDGCRVLELGCGTGGNLVPMALGLPGSQFVGIDLSGRQIEIGLETVRELGLQNIRLLPLSILDFDERHGEFDYIICHGVFSWTPRIVQEKILSICRERLAPFGAAYVSYNTFPGWNLRRCAREAMAFHVREVADPKTRVRAARAFLEFLAEKAPERNEVYSHVLKDIAIDLRKEDDTYIFHEYLEETNEPVYFRDFVARATAHGLQYLGEAFTPLGSEAFDDATKQVLQQSSRGQIEYEQYADILTGRTFRRSVLCHQGIALDRLVGPSNGMAEMHLVGVARPANDSLDVAADEEAEFVGPRGESVTTNHPGVKAALKFLHDRWPEPVPFAGVCAAVRERLGPAMDADPAAWGRLAYALAQVHSQRMLEVHVRPFDYCREPGERPVASPLARLQVRDRTRVATLRHALVDLDPLESAVLPLLDGTRDREAILTGLEGLVAEGKLEVHREQQAIDDRNAARQAIRAALDPCLRKLALHALLTA